MAWFPARRCACTHLRAGHPTLLELRNDWSDLAVVFIRFYVGMGGALLTPTNSR